MLFNKKQPTKSTRESMVGRLVYSPKVKSNVNYISEVFKGFVRKTDVKFPKDLGEEHPFNYDMVDKLVKKFGLVNAIVDKHVDYIFSGGIFVKSEDERALQIIEDWMQDVDFTVNIRPWVKQGLQYGFSPLELGEGKEGIIDGIKLLNSKWMYAKRDDFGTLEEYNQYIGDIKGFNLKKKETVQFTPKQIACYNYNVFGDGFYGLGLVWPLIHFVNNYVGASKEMHTLMRRKANNPLFLMMGEKGNPESYPTQSEVEDLGSQLEWLNNKHEWTLSAAIEPKTLDFGNVGDKFSFIIENDLAVLFMAAQIPAVLMGMANIPEGLAKAQSRAWELRIQSLREDIEKVIEQKIFKRILNAQGIDAHVEIEWGLPSQEEKNNKLQIVGEYLKNPLISNGLRTQMEEMVAELLELDLEKLESPEEERQREEEEEQQPIVPTERRASPSRAPDNVSRNQEHNCNHINCSCNADITEKENEELRNLKISEWVDFNYKKYNDDVIDVTKQDRFELLRGITKTELDAGLLTTEEIEKLRTTMIDAFDKNLTMREIEEDLNRRIEFKDRFQLKDGRLVLSKDGNPILALSANRRAISIARTETVRLSNLGALENYKKGGVQKIRFISALSERTCTSCAPLNGMVWELGKQPVTIPIHPLCRCTWSVATED